MTKKIYILILIVFCTTLLSNSRVSFTRPGALMRVSNTDDYDPNKLFSVALASEVTSLGDILSHSSSFAFNKSYSNGTSWGLNYTLLPYAGIVESDQHKDHGYEFGFHFQNRLYSTGRSNISFGVHDVIINDQELININNLSFFLNFSNSISTDNYTLLSLLGIGTGKMVFDPHVTTNIDSIATLGVYGAFKLNTPFLKQWGGMDFITEVVARSLNVGFVFPITREYDFSIGITNIENLSSFANQSSKDGDQAPLYPNAPAICFGLTANIPKINNTKTKKISQDYPILFINGRVDSSLFNAGQYIYSLQDSIDILLQDINTVSAKNVELRLNNEFFKDSLNNMILNTEVNNANQNEAMRYLSRSLRFYYQGDFKDALSAVDNAIKLQPNIAVAYARKGSIYYKLNQIDRATLNWNIALKLDPEYSEVRDMLNALKENKLRPISIDN